MLKQTERLVRIHPQRALVAPATQGQKAIWRDIEYMMPDTSFYNIVRPAIVPAGVVLDDVVAVIGETVERHESLRTLFWRDAQGALCQEVRADAQLQVEVYEGWSGPGFDPDAILAGLCDQLIATRFRHAEGWPVRALVAVLDDVPRVVLVCVSHVAADNLGAAVVVSELTERFEALVRGERPQFPAALQPIDLARAEALEQGQRTLGRALDYWRAQLSVMPPTMFPGLAAEPAQPRYQRAVLVSRAAAAAVDQVALRLQATTPVVLLAAVAAVLSNQAQETSCTMTLIAGNRPTRALRGCVTNLVQDVPATVDTGAETFAEVVRNAWRATTNAYLNSRYDRAAAQSLTEQVGRERGTELDLLSYFNDLRRQTVPDAAAAEPADAGAFEESRFFWEEGVERDHLSFFLVAEDEEGRLKLTLRADTTRLPRDRMAAFLYGLESFLSAVAADPDVPLREALDAAVAAVPDLAGLATAAG